MIKLNIDFKTIIINIIKSSSVLKKKYFVKHPNTKYSIFFILDELLYVLKTGLSWRNTRSPIHWNSLYYHFNILTKYNIFKKLFYKLRKKIKKNNIYVIDSSFVQNKNGKNYIKRNKFYKNKNGNKISLITDLNGTPLSIFTNTANKHDLSFIEKHFNDITIKNSIMLADKGYVSEKIRNEYKINFMIPKKKNQKKVYYFDKQLYKKRIIVENTFQKIKSFRRINQRYDSKISSFNSFLYFACSIIIHKNI